MIVLLPAADIPLGSFVTKRTGEKQYVLVDKITVYYEPDNKQVIPANEGALFLVAEPNAGSASAGINAVGASAVLAWHVEEEDLLEWLEERRQGAAP